MSEQRRLDFDAAEEAVDPSIERDRAARVQATDPRRNVALEASAGTGKTRVLVDRYVRLVVEAGVHPRHILAMTFTRKAAAEMRQRVIDTLRARHREGSLAGARWRAVREAFPEITINTIDAFCLSLLHEFPLEAGVDPAFDLADETETPRLVNAAIDRALRIGRTLAQRDADVALVFADLGEIALRRGLAALLDRRLVAGPALARFLNRANVTIEDACAGLYSALAERFARLPGGIRGFVDRGPVTPAFLLLAFDLDLLAAGDPPAPERLRGLLDRLRPHVLTGEDQPRQKVSQRKADFRSDADYEAHKAMVLALGPPVADALTAFRRDLNVVMARGAQRLFAIAASEYRRLLDKQGVLDFSDVLERALALLERRDEFSRSRFKLESRYQHLLVDEFQDTSRAQWRLVRELTSAWTEGAGAADAAVPPSIFIVGDRKQSIYGFRDAEVAVLEEAARYIDALRPDLPARAAITRSHRAVLPLLRFVNDVFDAVEKLPHRADAFRYSDDDRFPATPDADPGADAIGLIVAGTEPAQAEMIGDEIARLLSSRAIVRDRGTGARRPIGPGDIAVLFRTREGHRLIEQALSIRGVPFYVYKGLGFYDADEIRDVLALLAHLADPGSPLRAAAFLRSRFVRISDETLKLLAGDLPGALRDGAPLPAGLDITDVERLGLARRSLAEWQGWVDRLPPAELLDRVLADSAYAMELAGRGLPQARENMKKLRGLVRRLQNRGYATLERIVEHFSQLVSGGDESNAIIDAVDAVNLMTVHAAKGLEFPVVFVVNLGRGSGGGRDPIRVVTGDEQGTAGPMVGIGDHESEADADAEARDAEESKRLLYVALTRARDRLYLGGIGDAQGRFAPAKSSLGRHLPASLLDTFVPPSSPAEATWTGPSAVHQLRRVEAPSGEPVRWSMAPADPPIVLHDFAPLAADGVPRVSVSAERPAATLADASGPVPPLSSRDLGTFVHALVARAHRRGAMDDSGLASLAEQLAAGGSGSVLSDAERRRCIAIAAHLLASVQRKPGGGLVFEAPYSRRLDDGRIERGVIDCLVFDGNAIEVLEFKTGAAQAQHSDQLEAYVAAVRAAYPARHVEGRLVYVQAP
ncbi:MAG TPA: UvrD-helicase domain-containing protein [Vicinamibacterales bacterium]|nr:UvrD-helicase domain-containing protein [Vicinamibacterales bacterium]